MDETSTGLRTSDFAYALPPELIAQTPSRERGESRLMVVRRRGAVAEGRIEDRHFSDLPDLIPPGDLLILNTTRVMHARLLGRRPSGAPAEVLLLHPDADGSWIALGKPGSALRPGRSIDLGGGMAVEILEVLEQGYRRVRVTGASAEEAMLRAGRLPLPPYIAREPTPEDDLRYQTVFSEREGSVAAPTAGLHFTPGLLARLEARGVVLGRLDLSVGPGTFKPVEAEDPRSHPMHPERFEIPPALAGQIGEARRRGAAVWAAGTTVVRALESAAEDGGLVRPGAGETRLLITPGYRFRVVARLLTNFHLPRSTLLMLVAAFAGYETTMRAYRAAVEGRYRFYSYGDAMVVV
ncbi:MAG TPA: tRNA preQ1(34) S-adenosylmethionine ribosyltransferase-isomerase QueA [Gemmatimonadales bacterium]